MVRSTKFVRDTQNRIESDRQAAAQPARRARQVTNEAVHSTATDLGKGRKSSRLAEVNQVPKPARRRWMRPSALPHVPVDAIPSYRTRYTRIDGRNRGDRRNVEARLREGWEFATHSELRKYSLPAYTLTRYGEVIGNDDMVLMKLHEDLVEERNAEYSGRTLRQTQGVQDTLRQLGQQTGLRAKVSNQGHVDIPRRRSRSVAVQDDE